MEKVAWVLWVLCWMPLPEDFQSIQCCRSIVCWFRARRLWHYHVLRLWISRCAAFWRAPGNGARQNVLDLQQEVLQ